MVRADIVPPSIFEQSPGASVTRVTQYGCQAVQNRGTMLGNRNPRYFSTERKDDEPVSQNVAGGRSTRHRGVRGHACCDSGDRRGHTATDRQFGKQRVLECSQFDRAIAAKEQLTTALRG